MLAAQLIQESWLLQFPGHSVRSFLWIFINSSRKYIHRVFVGLESPSYPQEKKKAHFSWYVLYFPCSESESSEERMSQKAKMIFWRDDYILRMMTCYRNKCSEVVSHRAVWKGMDTSHWPQTGPTPKGTYTLQYLLWLWLVYVTPEQHKRVSWLAAAGASVPPKCSGETAALLRVGFVAFTEL